MDIASLLKSLNAHKVRYVIIGARALPVHGYARVTLDIDIFIEPTEENAHRTISALKATGYDVSDVTIKDLLTKKVLFRQYILETDIHPFVKGITFTRVWENKVPYKLRNVRAYFAGLDDLIRMKKAAGRAKDKDDLKILRKIKSRRRRHK